MGFLKKIKIMMLYNINKIKTIDRRSLTINDDSFIEIEDPKFYFNTQTDQIYIVLDTEMEAEGIRQKVNNRKSGLFSPERLIEYYKENDVKTWMADKEAHKMIDSVES